MVSVRISFIAFFGLASCTFGLSGSETDGGTPQITSPKTCSGAAVTSSALVRDVFAQHSTTKCLIDVFPVLANTNAEAIECVEDAFDGQNLELVDFLVGTAQMRCLSCISGSECSMSSLLALSPQDAESCIAFQCGGGQVTDVTSQVSTNGVLNATQCQWWCENNGYD